MRSKLGLLAGFALLLAFFTAAQPARADCTTYVNSHAAQAGFGDSPVCVGEGAGCVECINWSGSGGFTVCIRDINWYFYGCYSYGNPPENQWI